MGLCDTLVNLSVISSVAATLLFVLPMYVVFQAAKWILSWFVHENVRGKVVLITGASSGIGEHIAYEYAYKGVRLVLVGRREDQLNTVAYRAMSFGAAGTLVLVGDVTKEAECERLVKTTIEKFGRLDHLVNNAGLVSSFFFADCKDTKPLHSVVDTNFWGYINMTHFALPHLRKSHGKIMVNASIGVFAQQPREAIYNASKAAVLQFFDTLRVEEFHNIRITIVMPGFTESEATKGKILDEKDDMSPDPVRRDLHFGPLPMATAETVAKASVEGTIRGYRYVVSPAWWSAFFILRLLVPDLLDAMFYYQAVKNPKNPANKRILDATGAQKILYTDSTQKHE